MGRLGPDVQEAIAVVLDVLVNLLLEVADVPFLKGTTTIVCREASSAFLPRN